jgi:GrpB-like predicted nucleotidyltransferase (UPF0157 family)
MPALSPDAETTVDRYLALADAALPGRIEGLYLVGSVALGDYHPGQSDVDFVAFTSTALTATDVTALDQVHARLRAAARRPHFDGIYVTWNALHRNPIGLEPAFSHEGVFHAAGGFEANPSVWLTLHRYPLPVRGPATPEVWHDDAAIGRWNVENLNSYWRRAAESRRTLPSRRTLLLSRRALNAAVVWCVPGVLRLYYTIATGDVTSKTGACRYALETFPSRWSTIVTEALDLRLGRSISHRHRRVRLEEMLDFMDFVIDDANVRWDQGEAMAESGEALKRAPSTEEEIRAARIGEVTPFAERVVLAEYDPAWPALFRREEERIRSVLGDAVILLEHVGSTAVPGLVAKPRIDILLVVPDSSDEAGYVPQLEAAGYTLRIREPDWHQHRVLKGPDTDVNLHVFSPGSPEIERMLAFRDWLRGNEEDRLLYEGTKRELATREWKYVQNYADAKTEVVEAIIERARSHLSSHMRA